MAEKETMKLMKGMEVNKCRLCILTNQHPSTIGAFYITLNKLGKQDHNMSIYLYVLLALIYKKNFRNSISKNKDVVQGKYKSSQFFYHLQNMHQIHK